MIHQEDLRMTFFIAINNHEPPINQLNFEVPDYTVFKFLVFVLKQELNKCFDESSRDKKQNAQLDPHLATFIYIVFQNWRLFLC